MAFSDIPRQYQPLESNSSAILAIGVASGDMARHRLHCLGSLTHCDCDASQLKHPNIILSVADGHDLLWPHPKSVQKRGDADALVATARQHLEPAVTGFENAVTRSAGE